MGAVAAGVVERVEDQVALDVGDACGRQGAGDASAVCGGAGGRAAAPSRSGAPSGVRIASTPISVADREQHGAVDGVLELAHIAGPAAPRAVRRGPRRERARPASR